MQGQNQTSFSESFSELLTALQRQERMAWEVLIGRFRTVTIPWLNKKIGKLPPYALLNKQELVREIFAESLSKFFELFFKSSFSQEKDFQSLFFKIAELKTKEAFARLKKEALIYRPESPEHFEALAARPVGWTEGDELLRERAAQLQHQLDALEEPDRKLLVRVYSGEKMADMAKELGLTEESLRKRKQRALDRLRHLMKITIKLWLLLWIT